MLAMVPMSLDPIPNRLVRRHRISRVTVPLLVGPEKVEKVEKVGYLIRWLILANNINEPCILYTLYAYIILIVTRISEFSFKVAHMPSIRFCLLFMDWAFRNGCRFGHVLILIGFFILLFLCVGLATGDRNILTENAQTQCAKADVSMSIVMSHCYS